MLILGIESSCDETSCALVRDGREILSNIISSQIELHRKTGGVVPEVAAREHVTKIIPVIDEALRVAKIKLIDLDGIAVTAGPGLMSSLLIGANAAMTLAAVIKKPLIPVNHIEGHIYANWLLQEKIAAGKKSDLPQFPAAVLTVSGGHNELLIWKNHGEYKFLGATLDDAAGEAFDKVARIIGLSYPGGPAIQKAALQGDPSKYPLPKPWVTPWDFSFSGLKTAVLYLSKKHKHTNQFVADVAASFQESACEVLATKLINAAKKYKVKEVHLAGGVSANQRLREWATQLLPSGMRLRYCTDLKLCTDNAAMIAAAGYYRYKLRRVSHESHATKKAPQKYKKWAPISPNPNLEIKKW